MIQQDFFLKVYRRLIVYLLALLPMANIWAEEIRTAPNGLEYDEYMYGSTDGAYVKYISDTEVELVCPPMVWDEMYGKYNYLDTYDIPSSLTTWTGEYEYKYDEVYGYWRDFQITKSYSVASIAAGAFKGLQDLTSITIPNSIKSIGDNAFDECVSLDAITIPSSVEAIGDYAFRFCTSLKDVDIQTTAVFDASKVFYGCILYNKDFCPYETYEVTAGASEAGLKTAIGAEKLENIVFLKLKGTINSKDFMIFNNKMPNLRGLDLSEVSIIADSYIFRDGACTYDDKLPDYAFSGLPLAEVILPKTISSIGRYAFNNCNYLSNVEIPISDDRKFTMGDYAFENCHNLKSIGLPEGLEEIPYNAFRGSKKLDNITIPKATSKINSYAFERTAISKLDLSSSALTYIGYGAFYGTKIESITIPEQVTHVGGNAFYTNTLKHVVWNARNAGWQYREARWVDEYDYNTGWYTQVEKPAGWFPITGDMEGYSNPFGYSSSVETITFGETVERIPQYLFGNSNNGMSSITIPSWILQIGDGAFGGCQSLTDVYVHTILPIEIGENTFSNYQTATLHVPQVAYDNYWDAEVWSKFRNLKKEANEDYESIYATKPLTTNDNTGVVPGVPDTNINNTGSWTINTTETQYVNNLTVNMGSNSSASIISNNNFHANSMNVVINLSVDQWNFYTFPYDIDLTKDVEYDGSFAIYEYDGSITDGSGWRYVDGTNLSKGKGYIIQGSNAGDLNIKFSDVTFNDKDENVSLTYTQSGEASKNGWNLIGNPYLSYYSIKDLGYSAPVLVWDKRNMTYSAKRGGDDDYRLAPYEAFFVQSGQSGQIVGFGKEYRQSYLNGDGENKSGVISEPDPDRLFINLSFTNGKLTDQTRIVFNESANTGYEIGTDMAKMMSSEKSAPQIYSLSEGVRYAINERPIADGTVNLGVKVGANGTYTFSASKAEGPAILTDNLMGISVDLSEETYEVALSAGTYNERFTLNKSDIITGIKDINSLDADEMFDTYDITGSLIRKGMPGSEVKMLEKGIYILKSASTAYKVSVK